MGASPSHSMRLGLVGCTKRKLGYPAAAERLYSPSALFRGRRSYVVGSCDAWYILSAGHGLLHPQEELDPYDVTLVGAPVGVKRAWAARVLSELRAEIGELGATTFEIHAGKDYWGYGLATGLIDAGALVEIPTMGLSQGRQLQFYARRGPG